MNHHRDELRQLIENLETRVRMLHDFGVRSLKRQPSIFRSQVGEPNLPSPDSSSGSDSSSGTDCSSRAFSKGYAFGESQKAKLDQRIRATEERVPAENDNPPRGRQTALFGPRQGSTQEASAEPMADKLGADRPTIEEAEKSLQDLRQEIGECTRCRLAQRRTHLVFGEGHPRARLLLAGEGPGQEEDRLGRPFVGPAGQLLDRILAAMQLSRQDVYICNVVKCRPPENRTPQEDEMHTCGIFLSRQLQIIRPELILALGATAAKYLLGTNQSLNQIRGRFFRHSSGAWLMPTYHPAYLLRTPEAKKLVWKDVQMVMAKMEETRRITGP